MSADFDYAGRIERARTLMGERGIDVLLLSIGADLPYFTGYRAMPLERLTMFVLPAEGDPRLVIPALEAPRVTERYEFEMVVWSDHEDPVGVVAALAGPAKNAALGDATWSAFLLALQGALPDTSFVPASPLTRELRVIKDDSEVAALRAAGAATDRVVEHLSGMRFSGIAEADLASEIARLNIQEGHDESLFEIVGSGPNAASPHHEPTSRPIEPGDTVVIDFGGRLDGYCSDTTRTFSVGEPNAEVRRAYEVLAQAQEAARAAVRPGMSGAAVDAVAREIIDEAGYGEMFIHRTGHGIGLEEHEHPYLVTGNDEPLQPGMTFSIEPGIYAPGRWGMRIEDIVVCTEEGVDELNRSDRRLHIVE